MKKRTKILYFAIAASFPLMLSFQNCAKNAGQMQEAADSSTAGSKSIGAPVNSDDIPYNKVYAYDESNNPVALSEDSSSKGSDVHIQIEDPAIEHERDIQEAIVKCSQLNQGIKDMPAILVVEGSPALPEINVAGLRGSKVLSPADFDGRDQIASISNSYGTIVLCNLEVEKIFRTGGKIIAVDSRIGKITSHFGSIDLVNASAVFEASNIKVYRTLFQTTA
ncbi:MAG: hypothetical protein K2P92_08735, partial [Bdellovibrionaceae bacterium]|nr:hypothetical protein [Pseudobdellovibrionaceae bacterium]